MNRIRMGRTELMAGRVGFGAIPIQRLSDADAGTLLKKAYSSGVNFYDTARGYTDSEEKIGRALSDVRSSIIIATKTSAKNAEGFFAHLEISLENLKTDYVDIYQFHNPAFVPDESHELYQAALKAKKQGKIRFIGVTYHRLELAVKAVKSGLYDTVQFPLSAISSDEELELSRICKVHDVGLIAMKAMSGGLITSPAPSFALLASLGNVLPIWGMQHEWELDQILALEANPVPLDAKIKEEIETLKSELSGSFCRGCGYCMPTCPAKINTSVSARMSLLLRRTNPALYTTPESRASMEKIKNCTGCGICRTHCPYKLDVPELLKKEYAYYQNYIVENGGI